MHCEEARETEERIRKFHCDKDADIVAEILRQAREAANWSEADLRDLESLSGVSAYVSEKGDAITGFAAGRQVLDEAEILNLAVRHGSRRQGEGRRLVSRLLEDFRRSGVSRVFLEVRESNKGAIAFYESLGFRAAGERKDYYQGPREAAIVMETWRKESTDL